MYSSTHSLTSALDGGEGPASQPGHFTPRERAPGTHGIRGWVGPRAVLDMVVKRKIPSPHREWNPRTPINFFFHISCKSGSYTTNCCLLSEKKTLIISTDN
jgi:hypothetical protein